MSQTLRDAARRLLDKLSDRSVIADDAAGEYAALVDALSAPPASEVERLREAVEVLGAEVREWRLPKSTRNPVGAPLRGYLIDTAKMATDANPLARAAITPPGEETRP